MDAYERFRNKKNAGFFFSSLVLPALMMAGISGATAEGGLTEKFTKGIETLGHGFSPRQAASYTITWGALPTASAKLFSGGNKLLSTGIHMGSGFAFGPHVDPVFGVKEEQDGDPFGGGVSGG